MYVATGALIRAPYVLYGLNILTQYPLMPLVLGDYDLVEFATQYQVKQPTLEDFKREWVSQYPRLSSTSAQALVWRLRALMRVASLVDTVIDELVPVESVKEHTNAFANRTFVKDPFAFFGPARQLFPLSAKIKSVVDRLLRQTAESGDVTMPTLNIDRRKARRLRETDCESSTVGWPVKPQIINPTWRNIWIRDVFCSQHLGCPVSTIPTKTRLESRFCYIGVQPPLHL